MLTKFETKSNRVKGVSFHPRRPWILASLHNGTIQLWDYRMGTMLDEFTEHVGPVRGIDFHSTQPLFVSGGDDYKIKVWNYKGRRCLFTLHGHLDYIRSTQFHREYPWIVSASDDQTIRIWNWQSRQCTSILTGHNHYVMCAQFHPTDDMVVSASLDQTIRVWDISGLRKKAAGDPTAHAASPSQQPDLFGGSDAIVKYVLEGHDRGVNWATFHHSLPLVASGADDHTVRLWRISSTKAWEVDVLRGHLNNVSSVIFHPKGDYIVSDGEDKTIRVWDMSKRAACQSFRRENDRFWVLAAHPNQALMAAGHDTGFLVFKLERERPAIALHGDTAFVVKDKALFRVQLAARSEDKLCAFRPKNAANAVPRTLSYNPAEHAVLSTTTTEGGWYELRFLEGSSKSGRDAVGGAGLAAVWIARNRFAVLDRAHTILIKNLDNETTKKLSPGGVNAENMFYAGTGSLLIKADDRVVLFDIQQRKVVAQMPATHVKAAVFTSDNKHLALLCKHAVVIANRKMDDVSTVHETIRVKSGAWTDDGVFIYNTLSHLKYVLPNGDRGIIRTMDEVVYIVGVRGNNVHAITREHTHVVYAIDNTEYQFKLALQQRRFAVVLRMIKGSMLCGEGIIAYLQKKGFPEVALHFVSDEKTRFNLALECGNLEVALASAYNLDDTDAWHKLGVEALRQGNFDVVEMAYQRTKNFERLSFLYLITGNIDKLRKMAQIAERRGDVMSRFHNTLYTGDVAERVKVLQQCGHTGLAYVAAATHGLTDEAAALAEQLGDALPPTAAQAMLLLPPTPILVQGNWPLLTVTKDMFAGALDANGDKFAAGADASGGAGGAGGGVGGGAMAMDAAAAGGGWGADDLDLGNMGDLDADLTGGAGGALDLMGGGGGGGGGDGGDGGWGGLDDDLDLDLGGLGGGLGGKGAGVGGATSDYFVVPTMGTPAAVRWTQTSTEAADHVAAGTFDQAMQLLRAQHGIVHVAPLKPLFVSCFLAAHAALPMLPSMPELHVPLPRVGGNADGEAPAVMFNIAQLVMLLKRAYKETNFAVAQKLFVHILQTLPLVVVKGKQEENELRELIGICREYILGFRLRLQSDAESDAARKAELFAYWTHCNLQPPHLAQVLKLSIPVLYQLKNLRTCASFCRRLLELNPPEALANKARAILQVCEKNGFSEASPIRYDERNPFVVCGRSFVPIYRGQAHVRCPFCGQAYTPEHKGTVCATCDLGEVGLEVRRDTRSSEWGVF